MDSTARLWDLRDTKNIRSYVLAGHTQLVDFVSLTSDGTSALTRSNDKTIRLWDLRNTKNIRARVFDCVKGLLTPDGKWALITSEDGEARLLDLRDSNNILTYPFQGKGGLTSMTPDGKWAACLSNKIAFLWDLHDPNNIRLYPLQGHTDDLEEGITLTPDGKWALTGSSDNTARLWDLSQYENLQMILNVG